MDENESVSIDTDESDYEENGSVSKLESSENSLRVLWTVSIDDEEYVTSPQFSKDNEKIKWRIGFYLVGKYRRKIHFDVKLLCWNNTNRVIRENCTLNIMTTENITTKLFHSGFFDKGYSCSFIDKYRRKLSEVTNIEIIIQNFGYGFKQIIMKDQETCTRDTHDQGLLTTTPENVFDALLTSKKLSDFFIKVDGHEIPVHKCILALRSSVLCAMLENDFSESNLGYLEITDMDKDTISSFVRYLYTCKVVITNVDLAQKLFIVADKYDVQDLKLLCKKYILDNIKASNVVNILTFTDLHNADDIKARAIDYAVENIKEIDPAQFDILYEKSPHLMVNLVKHMALK